MTDDDIRDFLRALSAAGVRHIVVGAYALAAHGLVRATGDIDVLVDATPENAERLAVAVKDFAAASLEYFEVSVAALSRPGIGFFMGIEPDRIDILTKIAGVRFERAWQGRVSSEIAGVEVSVLSIDTLIAAKRASIRLRPPGTLKEMQDRADLTWLLKARARRPRTR